MIIAGKIMNEIAEFQAFVIIYVNYGVGTRFCVSKAHDKGTTNV